MSSDTSFTAKTPAMAPKTPMGANFMTKLTILRMMWEVLSKAEITGLTFSPMEAAAKPKNIAKMTIWSISFVAIASNTDLGMMCSIKCWTEKSCVFSVTSVAVVWSTLDKLTPFPGCKKLTHKSPIIKEINEAVKNQANALPPILPTDLRSPSLAIPTTKVVSTKGAIIIWTKRIKMVASILIYVLNCCAVASLKLEWTTAPKMPPSNIATKI